MLISLSPGVPRVYVEWMHGIAFVTLAASGPFVASSAFSVPIEVESVLVIFCGPAPGNPVSATFWE